MTLSRAPSLRVAQNSLLAKTDMYHMLQNLLTGGVRSAVATQLHDPEQGKTMAPLQSELRLRPRSTLLSGGCFSDVLIVWYLLPSRTVLSFPCFVFFLMLLVLLHDF